MSQRDSADDLIAKLAAGDIVPMAEKVWTEWAGSFPVVEDIDTFMAGHLLLVRRPVPGGKIPAWAIVEEPEPRKRVIRPLKTEKEARALIADRLAAYERMWDG